MDIYIYSDESGTFDYIHNDYFVFSGVIFFDKKTKDIAARRFSKAERDIRNKLNDFSNEIKACSISNANKGKLYRSMRKVFKFCVVINQKTINRKIFENKKHKQRYLDYAYKIVLKKCMETLIENDYIIPNKVRIIFVRVDEHHTATDGKYELRESLLNEFKNGTFNFNYEVHYQPIFPSLFDVELEFCDSKSMYLIRAADIIANHCYHKVLTYGVVEEERNMFIYYLPSNHISQNGLDYFSQDK